MAKNRDFTGTKQLGETNKMLISMDVDGVLVRTIKDIGEIDFNELDKMIEIIKDNPTPSLPEIKKNIQSVGDQSSKIQEEIDIAKEKEK